MQPNNKQVIFDFDINKITVDGLSNDKNNPSKTLKIKHDEKPLFIEADMINTVFAYRELLNVLAEIDNFIVGKNCTEN